MYSIVAKPLKFAFENNYVVWSSAKLRDSKAAKTISANKVYEKVIDF